MNLFDIMRGAGGGDPFSAAAAQLGLTQEQVARAAEAFLPGFSAGLKKSASDPFGFTRLMQAMATGGFQRAYEDPSWAFSSGERKGEDALALLFGSREVAEKTAELAAAYTGLAQETLKKLQAPLAAMLLGGLAERSTAGNPVLEAMMSQMRAAMGGDAPKGKGPLDRWEDEHEAQAHAASGAADMERAQAHMMEAGLAAVEAGTAAWKDAMAAFTKGAGAAPSTGSAESAAPSDLFGEMLEPGRRLGEAYQREVMAMLDRLSSSDTSRA